MKITFLDTFYSKMLFLDPILELCRTRRKRLYVLQEINPRWLQMKKMPFHGKLGLRSKIQRKSYVFDRENPVFEEKMKERRSIDEHFALGGSA